MRIIAGIARGRRLAAPKGTATRPTSDRAREGLFATVTAIRGPLPGARVLDLFAGSGAIGLEALSRGAVRVVFVESDARAAAFDLVVADPPYAASPAEVTGMLTALASGGWLAPGGLVAVERATREGPLPWPARYRADRSRRYGEATFWYGLAAAEAS